MNVQLWIQSSCLSIKKPAGQNCCDTDRQTELIYAKYIIILFYSNHFLFFLFLPKIKIFNWYFCFESWCRASFLRMSPFASLPCHNREWKLAWRGFGTTLRCTRAWPQWHSPRPCRIWAAGLHSSVRTKRARVSFQRFTEPAEPVITGWPC